MISNIQYFLMEICFYNHSARIFFYFLSNSSFDFDLTKKIILCVSVVSV